MGTFLKSDEKKRYIFLVLKSSNYSRTFTYYNHLRASNNQVYLETIDNKKIWRDILSLRTKYNKNDSFIVMATCHLLLLPTRLLISKNIFFDAGWSLSETAFVSRKHFGFLGFHAVKTLILDLIGTQLPKKIFVESNKQKLFFNKMFQVRLNKLVVLYTGLDEAAFSPGGYTQTPPDKFQNGNIILFRGSYNPEAGLECLAKATEILRFEPFTFWIYSTNLPQNIQFSSNTFVVTKIQKKEEIATVYMRSKITLGQLAQHNRLKRTIPHKAFEAAFMAKPYLTARNEGVLEIFSEGESVHCFEPGNPKELADEIKLLILNDNYQAHLSLRIKEIYDRDISQVKLAKTILEAIHEEF